MPRVFQLTALVLLALWVPATVHCGLEGLFDWATEHCGCDHTDDASTSVEHGAVEDGNYRTTSATVPIAAPDLLLCWGGDAAGLPSTLIASQPVLVWPPESPPELARTWQFVERTALPVRAPSRIS